MEIKRQCKVCGVDFIAIKSTQFFHSRKCFKKDFYSRLKAKKADKEQNPVYPSKECGFCSKISRLDFDPIKFFELHKKRHLDTARIAVKNTANQLVILTGDGRSWFLNKLRLHYHNIKKSKNLLLKTIKSMDDGEKERFLHYFRIKQIEERLEGL